MINQGLRFAAASGISIILSATGFTQEILPLEGAPETGSGLDGRYWQAGIKTIDNLDDKGGDKDIGLKIIRAAHPSGTFTATGLSYQGGNDLTTIQEWLQSDAESYLGVDGNMDDGLLSFTGYLRIESPGELDIRSESDDGSIIWIAGTRVVDNDGSHGAPGPAPDGIYDFETSGLYPIEVAWFNGDWTSDSGDHGGANLNILIDGEPVIEENLYSAGDVGAAPIGVSPISEESSDPGLAGKYWTTEPKGFEFGEGSQGPIFQTVPGDNHGIYILNTDPQGTFISSNVSYTGNDLTPISEWLGEDSNSFEGTEGNLDDGMVQLRGMIQINNAGTHDFRSSSDDGSVIRIGNQVVVDNDGGHGAPGPNPDGSAFFTKPGLYPIEVAWFNGNWTNDSGDHGGANIDLTINGEPLKELIFQPVEEPITLPSLIKPEPIILPTILLESFEDVTDENVGDVAQLWTGERSEYGIGDLTINPDLVSVTEGDKALEVSFNKLSGWGQDFQISLSTEASSIFEDAWNDPSPHRWWLLYDITVGSGEGNWANNIIWVGPDASYGDQVEVQGNWDEPITAFLEFDSMKNGSDLVTTEDGRVALGFGFNADLNAASKVWVDNIRLMDTYARGYAPEETLIDGLNDQEITLITESGFSVTDYSSQGNDDPRVTEGDGAVWIEVAESGWTTGAVMSLSENTVLNNILASIAPEDRVHYTISFDYVVIPDPSTPVDWFQFLPEATGLRLTHNYAGSEVKRTHSINLGSVAWGATAPNLNLITQGGFDGYVDVFVDNVRLFNAKGIKTAEPEPASITSAQLNANLFELTFSSIDGSSYSILVTDDISSGNWSEVVSGIQATGDTTTWQDSNPVAGQKFYRIQSDN
ncbi:MAG: hypothetical protein HN758_07505 [Verrucomicrobia bacterium]|jgi:hypothetical protein|nr:hypothetical protein [Verrucomicrobiota bacterium]MBT5480722.1 hypothetical protein [Verrucomicrobiota bacterium]MBT6237068.1 hypothetical protein [Verrucomicrobiota bacterium]MBT6806365.1 hypothetical protein [Verrucomicrobiota bacterium]MBT7535815.1 hypothetical protein [Verrucomicrobiota bacterium]